MTVMAEGAARAASEFAARLQSSDVIPACSSLNALCTDDTTCATFVLDAPSSTLCRLRWEQSGTGAAGEDMPGAAESGPVAVPWRHKLATPGQATAILALPGSAAVLALVQGTLELVCAERGECLQCLEVCDALLTAATLLTWQNATYVIAVSMLGDVVAAQVVPGCQAATPYTQLAPISRWRLDSAQYTDVALTPGEDSGSYYLWAAHAHCGVDVVKLLPAASWRLEQVAFIATAGRVRQLCACGSNVLAFTSELAVYMFPPGPGTVELDGVSCCIGRTHAEVLRAALVPQRSAALGTTVLLLCTTKANTLDLLRLQQGSGPAAALAQAGSWQLPDWGVGLSLCARLLTHLGGTPWPDGTSEQPGGKRARGAPSARLDAVASRAALEPACAPASQPVAGILCGVLSSPPRVMRGTVHQAAAQPAVLSST